MEFWYRPLSWRDALWIVLLAPLTAIFALLSGIRRAQYRLGQRHAYPSNAPVVVVGNISVGGTGKTPVTLALVEALQARGITVAIVSRGYGAQCVAFPRVVECADRAMEVGDEPLLLARRGKCPVVIDPDRCRGVAFINAQFSPNIIISDDGLQHYAMAREYEIIVSDAARGFGNGFLLPLGPLREPLSRLQSANAHFINGDVEVGFELQWRAVVNVATGERLAVHDFDFAAATCAIAGIGHPQRFFDQLARRGFVGRTLAFPDHHPFTEGDIAEGEMVVMTEKDAVKCAQLIHAASFWYVEVAAIWHNTAFEQSLEDIIALIGENKA